MPNDITNAANGLTLALSLKMVTDKDAQRENAILLANNICARLSHMMVEFDTEFNTLRSKTDNATGLMQVIGTVDTWSEGYRDMTICACMYIGALCVIREIYDALGAVKTEEYVKLASSITMFRNLVIKMSCELSRMEIYCRDTFIRMNNISFNEYIQEHKLPDSITGVLEICDRHHQKEGEFE